MAVIPVPKTPASAYNPNRRASQLLKDQVRHLEWAIRPASERQPHQMAKIKAPRTEAEAAARIAELTRQLHPEGAPKPARKKAAKTGKRRKPVGHRAHGATRVTQSKRAGARKRRSKTGKR